MTGVQTCALPIWLMLSTKLLVQKGYSTPEIAGKLGQRPFVIEGLVKLSYNYSEEQIEKRLKRCLDMDIAIKTGKMDQRIAVEYLVVEFAL